MIPQRGASHFKQGGVSGLPPFFPVFPGVFCTPLNTKIISSLIDPLKYLKNVIFLYPFLHLGRKNTPLSGGASPYSRS